MTIAPIAADISYRNLAAAIVEGGIAAGDRSFLLSPWAAWLCDMLDILYDATAITERLRNYYYRCGRWFCRRCGKAAPHGGRDLLARRCSCWTWFK